MNLHSANGHIGDAVWALTALARIGGEHHLYCNPDYVPEMNELVEGTGITCHPFEEKPSNSLDYWIASGQTGMRYNDPVDILGFVRDYFNSLASMAGQPYPFPNRRDLLCPFPRIKELADGMPEFTGILIINCDPKSGQAPHYSSSEMDALIRKLEDAGHSVCAVEKASLTLLQIAALSVNAKLILGCATGPWHACMNEWAARTVKVCILDPMRLDYGDGTSPIFHAKNAAHAEDQLQILGALP